MQTSPLAEPVPGSRHLAKATASSSLRAFCLWRDAARFWEYAFGAFVEVGTIGEIPEGIRSRRWPQARIRGSPDAPAVFYCHGFPGNRQELAPVKPAVERHGVRARVVALNRPGYGPSTFQAERAVLDWPGDVSQAADQFGIDRFAVLGASGGCPYALACGYALGDRVTRIGIVVGAAPIEATGVRVRVPIG